MSEYYQLDKRALDAWITREPEPINPCCEECYLLEDYCPGEVETCFELIEWEGEQCRLNH